MTIEIKRNALIVEADNVRIEEAAFEPIYDKRLDGSKDFSKRLGEDVVDEVLNLLSVPLEDLIYYRKAEYDSLSLILSLYNKLPRDKAQDLYSILKDEYV